MKHFIITIMKRAFIGKTYARSNYVFLHNNILCSIHKLFMCALSRPQICRVHCLYLSSLPKELKFLMTISVIINLPKLSHELEKNYPQHTNHVYSAQTGENKTRHRWANVLVFNLDILFRTEK